MNLDKYPRAKRFLEQHPGWTIEEALEWTEQQLEGGSQNGKQQI